MVECNQVQSGLRSYYSIAGKYPWVLSRELCLGSGFCFTTTLFMFLQPVVNCNDMIIHFLSTSEQAKNFLSTNEGVKISLPGEGSVMLHNKTSLLIKKLK